MKNDILSNTIKKILTSFLIFKSDSLQRFSSLEKEVVFTDEKKIPIAIHFHIFYTDLLEEICSYLNNISIPYDLYVSTDSEEKKNEITNFIQIGAISAKNVSIQVVENRGRDIFPFIEQMKSVKDNYEIIGHFHSKKTVEAPLLGDGWRHYLFENLLGGKVYADNLLNYMLQRKSIGFMAPPPYFHNIKPYLLTMKDKTYLSKIRSVLGKMNVEIAMFEKVSKSMRFPAGNMFFARPNAIYQVFESFNLSDFPIENGQIENTLQHTLERVWNFLVYYNGYDYQECLKNQKL